MLLFLEERLRADTTSQVVETDAMRRKRDDFEKAKMQRAEMESAVEKVSPPLRARVLSLIPPPVPPPAARIADPRQD